MHSEAFESSDVISAALKSAKANIYSFFERAGTPFGRSERSVSSWKQAPNKRAWVDHEKKHKPGRHVVIYAGGYLTALTLSSSLAIANPPFQHFSAGCGHNRTGGTSDNMPLKTHTWSVRTRGDIKVPCVILCLL